MIYNRTTLRLPDLLIEKARSHSSQVQKFLAGDIDKSPFKTMGIYELRQDGKYMVRVRIGAGQVWPEQLQKIAKLSKKFGSGVVHVTTRQDFQIHGIAIEDTPAVLEGLLEVGLASGGGGGNTVRNITACPRSGVCPHEVFDVAPYAVAAAEYLLSHESSFGLPRKFKVAFSGCSDDCAFAGANDLGFFASVRDGDQGFEVYAGGGLGAKPRSAVLVDPFVPAEEFLEVIEAMKLVFEEHGDRSNRRKARLRYVLERVGEEEFVKFYKEARGRVSEKGLRGEVPQVRELYAGPRAIEAEQFNVADLPINVQADKQAGRYTAEVHVPMGDVNADDLLEVAKLAQTYSAVPVRITQMQNLLICSVGAEDVMTVNTGLGELGLRNAHGIGVAACTGASTCRLGICQSRELGERTEKMLAGITPAAKNKNIRISGCPNSCGQHQIADLGLQGRLKRIDGEAVPHYDVYAGCDRRQGHTRLGQKIATVPEKLIPQFIAELCDQNAFSGELLQKALGKYRCE